MAFTPTSDAIPDSQELTHISHHTRRVMARLALSDAYRAALAMDPSLVLDRAFVSAAQDNADQLSEEVFAQ